MFLVCTCHVGRPKGDRTVNGLNPQQLSTMICSTFVNHDQTFMFFVILHHWLIICKKNKNMSLDHRQAVIHHDK